MKLLILLMIVMIIVLGIIIIYLLRATKELKRELDQRFVVQRSINKYLIADSLSGDREKTQLTHLNKRLLN